MKLFVLDNSLVRYTRPSKQRRKEAATAVAQHHARRKMLPIIRRAIEKQVRQQIAERQAGEIKATGKCKHVAARKIRSVRNFRLRHLLNTAWNPTTSTEAPS